MKLVSIFFSTRPHSYRPTIWKNGAMQSGDSWWLERKDVAFAPIVKICVLTIRRKRERKASVVEAECSLFFDLFAWDVKQGSEQNLAAIKILSHFSPPFGVAVLSEVPCSQDSLLSRELPSLFSNIHQLPLALHECTFFYDLCLNTFCFENKTKFSWVEWEMRSGSV